MPPPPPSGYKPVMKLSNPTDFSRGRPQMNYTPVVTLRDWERLLAQVRLAKQYYNFVFTPRRFSQERPKVPPVEYISFTTSDGNETIARIETHYVDLDGDSMYFEINGKMYLAYFASDCPCIVLKRLTRDGKTIEKWQNVTVRYVVVLPTKETPKRASERARKVTWANTA
jgi:hypothetical protein